MRTFVYISKKVWYNNKGGKMYCCIDLKSFFASAECAERNLDASKINLVVADPDRKGGSICLAISPALKDKGVKNRCRIYEIPSDFNYIIAKPRMRLYMEKSAEIFSIYLKYVSPEDMHIYSVDECFIDLTDYEKFYNKTPIELAKMLIGEVYAQTKIRATVGLGTNLFLAKVALDITAKHSPDFIGVLDEKTFKETIWFHRPITDVWNVGRGIANRLERMGIYDLHGITETPENVLYKEFGINAELLIDHAHGIEPCTIKDIHAYRSKSNSISNGQILFRDYEFDEAKIILREMVDNLCLELIEKDMVTNSISLSVGYADRDKKHTGGTIKLGTYTSSIKKITDKFLEYFEKTADRSSKIRKINIGLNGIIESAYRVYDMFTDVNAEEKESKLNKTVINIKHKYGKNSLLKGTSFEDCATAKSRNRMIGGHNGGEND